MAEQKEKKVTLTGKQMVDLIQFNRERLEALNAKSRELGFFHRELMAARDSLNELKKNKKEQKILVNLGAGNFIDATTEKELKVKYGIAGNVIKETTVEKAIEEIEKKMKDVEKELEFVRKEQENTGKTLSSFLRVLSEAERQRRAQQVG
jgi:prefoldin alpha subunit